ncbi:gp69 [Escherichia phage phiEB49]|uniref:Gp69 n=1 Tax=Escherichia phage phiEB49 TaxID=1048207 RepID=F8UBX9_9CAUD|nr:gp69 [Escherichia phage phiEB49]AEI91269.1 gp69 [Escherichia phage phiEB49]
MSKYNREIIGLDGTEVTVDVYRVLDAFCVTDPAIQHAIKKMLCTGLRGHKDYLTDLNDAIESLNKAVELRKQRDELGYVYFSK